MNKCAYIYYGTLNVFVVERLKLKQFQMLKEKTKSKSSITLGDMINWWNQNGHFNEKLYIRLSTVKSIKSCNI